MTSSTPIPFENEFPIIQITPEQDPSYDFWNTFDPPKQLFVQGHPKSYDFLCRLPEEGLAVVGTRHPQARSLVLTEKMMAGLRSFPRIILSGMAYGIDAHAHRHAIQNQLPTIAVMGTALDQTYPRAHVQLRYEILKSGGLILSELTPGVRTIPAYFVRRNRLIACLSRALVVVEAGAKSGALSTARAACENGERGFAEIKRFAVPCFPGDPYLAGNQYLLETDAGMSPYWNPLSLGEVWMELVSKNAQYLKRGDPPTLDVQVLIRQIRTHATRSGGVALFQLHGWARAQGWTSERFFDALRLSLESGFLREHQQVLFPTD